MPTGGRINLLAIGRDSTLQHLVSRSRLCPCNPSQQQERQNRKQPTIRKITLHRNSSQHRHLTADRRLEGASFTCANPTRSLDFITGQSMRSFYYTQKKA